jgi:hypothetical protein
MKRTVQLTILDLIHAIQDATASDDEAVAVFTHILKTRRVLTRRVLTAA